MITLYFSIVTIVSFIINVICFALVIRKEKDMAVVYATLIVKGLRTIDSVPEKIRAQVEEILKALEV